MFNTELSASADVYDLADEYGADAAANLNCILQALESAGFPKAHRNSYSAFDRVLSGIAWLLQRIVKRENADQGRVQFNFLYQSFDNMKSRLGLAQEVIRCVEALDFACPLAIQPHQLLLQDFGDIETAQNFVLWLISEGQDVPHLAKIRRVRAHLKVESSQNEWQHPTPLKKEVRTVVNAFAPTRRWQYIAAEGEVGASEDALIQRCLLEYGERLTEAVDEKDFSMDKHENEVNQRDIMAWIASQAAEIATAGISESKRERVKGGRKANNSQAIEFDRQYLKVIQQAKEEQQMLVSQRRENEAKLLQQVVSVPRDNQSAEDRFEPSVLHLLRAQLKEYSVQVRQLIHEKQMLEANIKDSKTQAAALDETLSRLTYEIAEVEAQIPKDEKAQAHLKVLHQLVMKNEALKREKKELRINCREELKTLKERVEKLKAHAVEEANNQDADALRLYKIEQMHAQMAEKHTKLKIAAAEQTRAVYLKLKQIDEIPTQIEVVQYEKRFLELYDEVALTLDETRKYYCVYNTLKSTHEYLEKEVSLISSIIENVDVAMASKTATQAFFIQLENIIQNVQSIVAKQQKTRNTHQANVETLDSKYQLLVKQERLYLNAIREFQKACEINERLVARLEELDQH